MDTSVWVDFFNGYSSPEADDLVGLLEDEAEIVTCGLILAEFFQGVRNQASLNTLERFFRDMVCLTPAEPDSHFAAAGLYRNLRAQSISVRSTIDCLVARLAEEAGVMLLAKDRDMKQIVTSGFCRVKSVPL